ncbi:hypothetical protein R1sor_016905 [Riccia sorocarpa]|uniref:Programmed cell death protein 7 n=1 Tax=Riccia sorocarpa TaxID=122646 RepID=A0ABD3HKG8_9MARC
MSQPGYPPASGRPIQHLSLPSSDPLLQTSKLKDHLANLLQNAAVLRAIGDELEAIQMVQAATPATGQRSEIVELTANDTAPVNRVSDTRFDGVSNSKGLLLRAVEGSCTHWPGSVSLALQAAKQLQDVIKLQLRPLQEALNGDAAPEKAGALAKLISKRQKLLRNRKWRSRKRMRVAEALQKERDNYEAADREADEWRAKEIAKSIAKRKMEKMKALAEKKAKEEKARRQQESEMVILVEKLQELRALRVAKLKKQGRFFPEEDDQFMEKVRAAVAEEERQAAAAADTNAATAAILNAEEARKAASALETSVMAEEREDGEGLPLSSKSPHSDAAEESSLQEKINTKAATARTEKGRKTSRLLEVYEGLPVEYHHYYLGSTYDIGTLIEVRQGWDAFIMPGGSRIPQHWIEPPPPADDVWASYLVQSKKHKKGRKMKQREKLTGQALSVWVYCVFVARCLIGGKT